MVMRQYPRKRGHTILRLSGRAGNASGRLPVIMSTTWDTLQALGVPVERQCLLFFIPQRYRTVHTYTKELIL